MGLTALLTIGVIIGISLSQGKEKYDEKGIPLSNGIFKTHKTFNIAAFAVCIICAVLYVLFW